MLRYYLCGIINIIIKSDQCIWGDKFTKIFSFLFKTFLSSRDYRREQSLKAQLPRITVYVSEILEDSILTRVHAYALFVCILIYLPDMITL